MHRQVAEDEAGRFPRKYQLLSFFVLSYASAYTVVFGYITVQPGQPMGAWSLPWFLSVFWSDRQIATRLQRQRRLT